MCLGGPKQMIRKYKGYKMYFENSSYNCPLLKLCGFKNDRQLEKAIDREIKKRLEQIPTKEYLFYW